MRKRAPIAERGARARMWQAMRQLRRFSTADLQATAEVSATHARKYVKHLAMAQYIVCVKPRASGFTGGHATFSLARNTGPHAPRFGKQGVLDPNLEPATSEPGQKPVMVPRADYERALQCVKACAGMVDPVQEIAELRQRAARADESGSSE